MASASSFLSLAFSSSSDFRHLHTAILLTPGVKRGIGNGMLAAEFTGGYRANETRQFARMLGLEPKNTAVRSPESNGIAESFVKTIKRDYISIMPKPDGLTAAKNLAEAFEHYNEWHPHSALGYRSPREYLRQQASNGLSDNRCLEI